MTPLQLFLIQIVIVCLCIFLDWSNENKKDKLGRIIALIGGVTVVSIFGTLIYAVLFYVKI